jgi:hypothetical protein
MDGTKSLKREKYRSSNIIIKELINQNLMWNKMKMSILITKRFYNNER